MYKKFVTLGTFSIFPLFFSQVIIGDDVGTAPANNKPSVLLEFANTGNKGIILPYVKTILQTTATEGSIIVDASTPIDARIKYYNGNMLPGTNGWIDLSGQGSDITSYLINQPIGINEANAKAIIGNNSATADGVLVLESQTKAMVLPIVSDTNNIVNPSPGMIVYVNKPGAKRLAVFNGSKWSYWMQ